MKKSKQTKKLLFSSVIALILCFSMLLGTTFAWFTDSVTSANNIIKSGNLDVELYHTNTKDNADKVTTTTKLFDEVDPELWEPGALAYENLTVMNEGSLALKYQLAINFANATAVNGHTLAEALKVGVKNGGFEGTTREAVLAEVTNWQTLKSFVLSGKLLENESDVYGIVIYWEPSANDNWYNMNNENQGKVLSIDLGVNLFATQVEAESDSFGKDYDQGAPIVSVPIARPDSAVTLKGSEDVMVTLTDELVDKLPAAVTEISLAVSEPVVDTTNDTITFKTVELVDQNGNVIDLEALNLDEDIVVTLPAQTQFAVGETVMVYHDGEPVANAVVGANGVISYSVAHLCEITVGALGELTEKDNVVEISNVAQLFAFAQAVNAGNSYAGKTVVLTNNIDLNNVNWTPIGNWDKTFDGVFDGNGKTISNLYINDAKGEGVGFFGVVQNATIKNLTIKNANINAYSMVAGIVGAAYPATISNCFITGNVNIVSEWAYVAGVAGYCYYGTQVEGCSVIADESGLIQSETRNGVGGITAWLLEGNHKVTNCQVKNLNLVGWTNVGGITGFVHYNNTIEGCSVENVKITKTRADGNPGIGLIAGGWSYHASNAITLRKNIVNEATLEGNHIAYAAYDVLYGSEYGGATTTNFVLENNTTTEVTNNLVEVTKVTDAVALRNALAEGKNVVLGNDITMAAVKGGYNKAGIVINKGQILDGNGYTLTVTGAGATWDCAIYLNSGTVKNITVAGAMRGIFTAGQSSDLYMDNVSFKNVVYTFNSDDGNKDYTVYISNSTVNGWTSHSDVHKKVVYTNCEFGKGSGYAFCRPYGPTEFVGCNFSAGYEIDARGAVTFENCTLNGVALTAENLATLVTGNTANATIK